MFKGANALGAEHCSEAHAYGCHHHFNLELLVAQTIGPTGLDRVKQSSLSSHVESRAEVGVLIVGIVQKLGADRRKPCQSPLLDAPSQFFHAHC